MEFLRRSRGAMITVQIFDIGNRISYVAEIGDLMRKIAQQSDRIMRFEAVGLSSSIAEALISPADNLAHLTINGGAETLPLVFDGRMPRLKRLTLSNPTGWYLRTFPDITRVELFGSGSHIHLSSLMSFLEGAVNLERLSLSRFQEFAPGRRMAPGASIALPSLRELHIYLCHSQEILEYLELPPSTRVSILSGHSPNTQHILHCLPNAGSLYNHLFDTRTLTIALHPTDDEFYLVTRVSFDQPKCFLQVHDDRGRFDGGWILNSVEAIVDFKPFFNINTLNLSVEVCPVPWTEWLPQLSGLVNMDIHSVNIAELVFALNRTHPQHGGPVCPSLRYISVEQRESGPALNSSLLKSCLLARSQAGCSVSWLRLQSWEWTPIDRADLGWSVLIKSQGMLYAFSVFVYS